MQEDQTTAFFIMLAVFRDPASPVLLELLPWRAPPGHATSGLRNLADANRRDDDESTLTTAEVLLCLAAARAGPADERVSDVPVTQGSASTPSQPLEAATPTISTKHTSPTRRCSPMSIASLVDERVEDPVVPKADFPTGGRAPHQRRDKNLFALAEISTMILTSRKPSIDSLSPTPSDASSQCQAVPDMDFVEEGYAGRRRSNSPNSNIFVAARPKSDFRSHPYTRCASS
ncbi:hypothetical protein M427DRAFT_154323 [Gonapodya prolifera JEL478]|uniref:Uncharacterized protein n=1 Tax=Gonapodya prolifera (strain JEL478) TaxID=1344416 RepID=A0A139AIN6_GONPJ|nr:hypothetical protein M427DRAFT_154323 [Gonapodya prolifera JEL478]|eukprot:KXS16657.1 hypothetical protein M427DRAFT_154323 [Gonapodya prolifera JEL478]